MTEVVASYHDRVRTDILPLAPERAGRVLDLGGGIGATGARLKALGRAEVVVLADQVADTVAHGVDRAYAGDLEDLGLIRRIVDESGPFDTILCLDILEHLRDPWGVLRELREGLAPGGCVVVSLPNLGHLSVVAPLVLRGRFDLVEAGIRDRTHLRWFTLPSILDLIAGAGLAVEAVQKTIPRRLHKAADILSARLLNRFFVTQYVVRARRPD